MGVSAMVIAHFACLHLQLSPNRLPYLRSLIVGRCLSSSHVCALSDDPLPDGLHIVEPTFPFSGLP